MRIRTIALCALSALAVITAAGAAEIARTPSAYTSLTTVDASACARACAHDGICMAWSFHRDNRCDLSAIVPASADPTALVTGVGPSAPANLQPRTPVIHAEAAITRPAPPPAAQAEAQTHAVVADDNQLLGGPEEGDLRLGLR